MKEETLTVNEIYHSIQGESTWAGEPCVFVRLTFCDLRCNYCDTEYAFYEGKKQPLPEIVTRRIPLVGNYKFVKFDDRILLVDPDNREVVAQIPRYKLAN